MNSPAPPAPPPIKKALMMTALTALVSGVIGAGITIYTQRAQPSLTLISVGFRGPTNIETIDVGDPLVSLTGRTGMVPSLKRFESFDKLSSTEKTAAESLILLQQSIDAVEAWKKRYSLPPQNGQIRRLSPQAMADHPFSSDEVVGGTLTALIRQGELPSPPIPLIEVIKQPVVVTFGEVEPGEWVLVFGKRQHVLKSEKLLPQARQAIRLLATSFGYGSYDNVEHYSNRFIEEARRELEIVRQISDGIKAIILPNAVISARLMVENRGGKAVTLSPNFALHFQDSNLSMEPLVLRVTPQKEGHAKNPFSLNSSGGFSISIPNGEEDGKRAQVKPFLPDPNSYPYISIPPGEIREISVTGSSPLGKSTGDLLTIYQSKLLRFSVVGSTVGNDRIQSAVAIFSEKISEDEKKLLQRR